MRISEKKSEGGQSLVEFAVALVILLYLVVVIADGARALFTYLSMRDAAQEAAAYASAFAPYDPSNPSVPKAVLVDDIENRVCGASNMIESFCDNSDLVIAVTPTLTNTYCMGTSTGGIANGITVAIDYPQFPLAMPFVATFIGRQWVPIHTEVTDTILSPKCP